MKPLEDVRIVAVEQYGAGPWGSMQLADLGADVIKVEDPSTGGDVGRYVPPFQADDDSLFFQSFNRNKRAISLDITNDAGRGVFEDLLRTADALCSNLRGDVPAKLGLRYEDVKHANAQLVCCSLSAYGMTGPRASDPGYDYMLQGTAGWMDVTGEPDGPPTKSGLSLVDYSGGYVAAIAVLAGIHAARRDGFGMDCDLSLFDTAISLLTYPATWHLSEGFMPIRTRNSAHPSLVPFQNFATSDGWVVVGCAKEKFWRRLAVAIDLPELADDPRFANFAARSAHRDELLELLESRFSEQTTGTWVEILSEAGVPCAPVNDIAAALRDPQVAARNLIAHTEHPRFGTVAQVASSVRVGDEPVEYRRAPFRHEHADEVLRGILGYDSGYIDELSRAGAFGDNNGQT